MDPLVLRRVGPRDWVLQNGRFSSRDARHVVAALHEMDGGDVDVLWLQATALPTRYPNVADAMEDFLRWSRRPGGGTAADSDPTLPAAVVGSERVELRRLEMQRDQYTFR